MASCVVAGVAWDVLGDFGDAPFILDRDVLDDPASLLTTEAEALTSIGELVLSAGWTWGAGTPLGPLTTSDAGRAIVSLIDTTRLFDPLNTESPWFGYLRPGLLFTIRADGQPAFTGRLLTWVHDVGTQESVLEATDAIGVAGATSMPALAVVSLPTIGQAEAIMDGAGLPRHALGGSSFWRTAYTFAAGSVLEALLVVRLAELASLAAGRDGSLIWRGSPEPYVTTPPTAVINCGGAMLAGMGAAIDRARVRNVVRIDGAPNSPYTDAGSVARNGPHEIATSVAELALA